MKRKCTNSICYIMSFDLYQTGYSEKQGCTHYCPVCGWGYWTHIEKPSKENIDNLHKANPKISRIEIEQYLTQEILRPYPPVEWGKGSEKKMIEHLGGDNQPFWLPNNLKKYWRKKYLESKP